jgi:hypothetical protein
MKVLLFIEMASFAVRAVAIPEDARSPKEQKYVDTWNFLNETMEAIFERKARYIPENINGGMFTEILNPATAFVDDNVLKKQYRNLTDYVELNYRLDTDSSTDAAFQQASYGAITEFIAKMKQLRNS